eukprot:jgi/Tetstr1/455313/TSEL_042148.t1
MPPTVLAAVERVLGSSFDPSTCGADTNPVVTDFLTELMHDPDPMAAKAATLSEDPVARLGSVLGLVSFNATSSARRYDHYFLINDARGSTATLRRCARRGAASKRLLLGTSLTQMPV